MKICISSTGENIDADVDPRFGRCRFFLVTDIDGGNVEAISNEGVMASGGAGIQAAQKVANTGVEYVITGNIGPNAFQTLNAANIKVITGVNGKIRNIIEQFKKGELKETGSPSVGSHFGMGNR